MMDKIVLVGMEFYGYHGCLPTEREQGQRFVVDAELFLELRQAGKSEALQDTVNYADVFEQIRQIVEGEFHEAQNEEYRDQKNPHQSDLVGGGHAFPSLAGEPKSSPS